VATPRRRCSKWGDSTSRSEEIQTSAITVRASPASSALSAVLVMLMALFTVVVLTTVWLVLG